MAYDNDFRSGQREREGRNRDGLRDRGESDHGRDGRGFFERAGDEVASWFGDDDAGRRREQDERGSGQDRDQGGWFTARSDGDRDRQERDGRDGGRPGAFDRDEPTGSGFANRYVGDRQQRPRDDYRPITGDYGRSGPGERGWSGREQSSRDQSGRGQETGASGRDRPNDPHYSEWRQRQIDALDRDYDDYRREHQSKFENDFSGWRTQRQSKREILSSLRDGMEVVGSDEQRIGSVDKVSDDRVILRKNDPEAGGVHRSFSCSLIDRVDGDRLILTPPAEQARTGLQREDRGEAYSPRERESGRNEPQRGNAARDDGPHVLERSFSGTYR